MKDKGFFDILLVLTMILLFLPSINLPNTQTLTDNILHIDQIAFIIDEIVVDALADQTSYEANPFAGLCEIKSNTVNEYNTKIINYINTFENERKKYTDINCTYDISSSNFNSSTSIYRANIDIRCDVVKKNFNTYIEKKLIVNKKLEFLGISGECHFYIYDNDESTLQFSKIVS
jgi:hypothetical protein